MEASSTLDLSPNTFIGLRVTPIRFYIAVSCLIFSLASPLYLFRVVIDSRGPFQSVLPKENDAITFNELFGKSNETSLATKYHKLDLNLDHRCIEESGPSTPVILMSLGRSGSSVIWTMMSALTNSQHGRPVREYTGNDSLQNLYFFDRSIRAEEKLESISQAGKLLRKSAANIWEVPGINNSVHGVWLQRYMCRLQSESSDGIVGFKWKSHLEQFIDREEAMESLQMIAILASLAVEAEQKPPILVVRSRRNMIDVKLSNLKHDWNPDLHSHCRPGDDECINSHKEKQFVHDIPNFYRNVSKTWTEENLLDQLLSALKVPFVSVSYDRLFYPDQIRDGEEEWNRIIQFISPSSARFSWGDVHNDTRFVATSSQQSHVDVIENWKDVYEAFQDTEIEHLFRKD